MDEQTPLLGRYVVECTGDGCFATRVAYLPYAMGLSVGDKAPTSTSDPSYGRCFKCSRYNLKIREVPPQAPPEKPVGFTKVPTE